MKTFKDMVREAAGDPNVDVELVEVWLRGHKPTLDHRDFVNAVRGIVVAIAYAEEHEPSLAAAMHADAAALRADRAKYAKPRA